MSMTHKPEAESDDRVKEDRTPMSHGGKAESEVRTTKRNIRGVRRTENGYEAFGSKAAEELQAGALNIGGMPTALTKGSKAYFQSARAYVRPDMHRDGVLFVTQNSAEEP